MAVRYMEGFDWANVIADIAGRGSVSGGIDLITGLQGSGRAMRMTGSAFATRSVVQTFDSDITNGRCILHMWFRISNNYASSTQQILAVRNTAGTAVWNITSATGGTLAVRRGTTTLLTLTGAVSIGVAAHFVFDVVVHASAGSIHVYKDGDLLDSIEGVNTQNASGNLRSLQWATTTHNNDPQYIFDDLLVEDEHVRGPLQVTYHPVDSDVGTSDWTPSAGSDVYAVLDETPGNGDTDRAASSVADDTSRHGITPGLAGKAIYAVQPIAVARVEATSTSRVQTTLHSDTSDDGGSSPAALTTAYRGYVGLLAEVDPATTAPWTAGGLDAVELELTHIVPA
jgi:hypothetical protein